MMASAVSFEEEAVTASDDVSEDAGEFTEFQDIQRALAAESGQEVEPAEPDIQDLVEHGLDSGMLEAERVAELSEEEVETPPPAPESKANKRIQTLIAKNKEIEAEAKGREARYQEQLGLMQRQIQNTRAEESRATQQQLEMQRQQLAMMQQQRVSETEKSLTPQEQYERDFLRRASDAAKGAFTPEVAALRTEIEQMKQVRQQETAEAQKRQQHEYYNSQTRQVREELLKSFSPDRAAQLAEPIEELVLSFSGAWSAEPKEIGPRMKKFLDTYVQGVLETRAKSGQKIRKGQAVPRSASGGKRTAKGGGSTPSFAALRKAGYNDYVEWMAQGEPAIES